MRHMGPGERLTERDCVPSPLTPIQNHTQGFSEEGGELQVDAFGRCSGTPCRLFVNVFATNVGPLDWQELQQVRWPIVAIVVAHVHVARTHARTNARVHARVHTHRSPPLCPCTSW